MTLTATLTFLFQTRACEDEITFAWDKRKTFLPVLSDLDSILPVLNNPEQFLDRNSDICEVSTSPLMLTLLSSSYCTETS